MNPTQSNNWSVFSTDLEPENFPREILGYAAAIVSFLDRIDSYQSLLNGLPTYAPLNACVDELRDVLDEAVEWLNEYLQTELSIVSLVANLKDDAAVQLDDALDALSDVSLALPKQRDEEFLRFYLEELSVAGDELTSEQLELEEQTDYLLDDDGELSDTSFDDDDPDESEDVGEDANITPEFLYTVNVLLSNTETLAERIVEDLRRHGYLLHDVLIGGRVSI